MGKRGSAGKTQSIRFPMWMANAIQEIVEKYSHTFSEVVIEFCRKELESEGYTMGIGREAAESKTVIKGDMSSQSETA